MKNYSRNNWQDGRHFHKPNVPVPSAKTRVTPIAARASWARQRTEYDPLDTALEREPDQGAEPRTCKVPGTNITMTVTGYDPRHAR